MISNMIQAQDLCRMTVYLLLLKREFSCPEIDDFTNENSQKKET